MTTEQLQQQLKFQQQCIDILNTMPPKMKQDHWQQIIQDLLENVVIIQASMDSSPRGQLNEFLEQFLQKAQANDKSELLIGRPWLHEARIYFKLSNFIQYLDRQNFKEFKSNKIASLLRDRGGDNHFFNIKGRGCNCWSIPDFQRRTEIEQPKIDPTEPI